MRAYLRALLPTRDDADDVEQEFLLQVVEKGFPTVAPGRGQFRHYLIAVVRNAAFGYLRRRSKQPSVAADLSHVADLSSIAIESAADQEWQRSWRECVLLNTWHALRDHQKKTKGNQFHTVLKASVEHPEEDSPTLAARVSKFSGQTLSPESFRKQLSRARVRFGELLVEEVSRTITDVTPELLSEELGELDLLKYVRTLLPGPRDD